MLCGVGGFGYRIPNSRIMPPPTSLGIPLREVSTEATTEIEKLKVELREIEVLLRQTNNEIERVTQKNLDAAARLRQIESNFDAFSREDIKQAYSTERDTQLKLLMMRSQLERFQNKQHYLDRYIQQLRHLGDLSSQAADQISSLSADSSGGKLRTSDHQAVIQAIEAQEQERQRLAQQMHDGPAQSLTNLILQAEIVQRLFETNPERARTELGNLKTSANVTFQRVRDFIFGLRPMMLDDLGLNPTLRRYVQTFETKTKLPLIMTLNGDRTLSSYVEVTIFRTVQELLSNAARHANASRAQVSVDSNSEPIVVTVEDDGAGFDVNDVLARVRARGSSGLVTLEKRIEMLGGKITYQSGTGRGTRVRVEIPST
jgi:two-component system sensor histidine kinase DegS